MFSKIINLFKIPVLRKKLFFTFCLLGIYRMGIFITIPGIDRYAIKSYLDTKQLNKGFLNLFNFLSGGALEKGSIFALGVMPYITSSIIMSLLVVVIPIIDKLQKEGEEGRKKVNQYTKYGAIFISLLQSVMIASYLKNQLINGISIVREDWIKSFYGIGFILIAMITLTAGTAFIMWIGDMITENGVGNGISLIIFAGIIVRTPYSIYSIFTNLKNNTYDIYEVLFLFLLIFFILIGIVFIEKGQRRIPVQYAKRVIQNKEYGGKSTHIPLKINISGVIPPIFASTILMFPATLVSMMQSNFLEKIQNLLTPNEWRYQLIFVLMIIFFSYFYVTIQFNSSDVSENIRKFGGFIPGIRPGLLTINYINKIVLRITFSGSIYLSFVCIIPILFQELFANDIPFIFGGTGLLIVVSISLDVISQIEGYFISKKYDYFTNKINSRIRIRNKKLV